MLSNGRGSSPVGASPTLPLARSADGREKRRLSGSRAVAPTGRTERYTSSARGAETTIAGLGKTLPPPYSQKGEGVQGVVTACYNNKQRDNSNSNFFTAGRRHGRGDKKNGAASRPVRVLDVGVRGNCPVSPVCRRMGSIILR